MRALFTKVKFLFFFFQTDLRINYSRSEFLECNVSWFYALTWSCLASIIGVGLWGTERETRWFPASRSSLTLGVSEKSLGGRIRRRLSDRSRTVSRRSPDRASGSKLWRALRATRRYSTPDKPWNKQAIRFGQPQRNKTSSQMHSY